MIKNLKETLGIFLQSVPSEIDLNTIQSEISMVDKVISVHQLNIWSLDGENHILTIHIVVDEITSINEIIEIKNSVKAILRKIPIERASIEIEFKNENCYSA